MSIVAHKHTLQSILKTLTPDRRKRNIYGQQYFRSMMKGRELTRKSLRQLERQEYEMKRMKWKKVKSLHADRPTYEYTFENQTWTIVYNPDNGQAWLGKSLRGFDVAENLGWLPDIETAKYFIYLITIKTHKK